MAYEKTWMPQSLLSDVLNQSTAQKAAKPVECICSRPLQDVLCKVCGLIFTARVRKLCTYHPRTINLMDFQNCPRCRNCHLHEFRASEKAQNKAQIDSSTEEVATTPLHVTELKGTGTVRTNNLDISSTVSSNTKKDQMEDLGLSERR